MRYVFLGNNRLGVQVLRWLRNHAFTPSLLVVHPPERARFRDELIGAAGLERRDILLATELSDPAVVDRLRAAHPDVLLSVLYGYILPTEVLTIPKRGAINLHTAMLPYNRGAYPNVWSIIDGTPAGVTLHYMDEGVDTGDIIAQREVLVHPVDTGASLYERLEVAALELFRDVWPLVVSGNAGRQPQVGAGTFHRIRDVDRIDRIDPDSTVKVRSLLDIIRARTFPPYRGAYLEVDGRRVQVSVALEDVGDARNSDNPPSASGDPPSGRR